MFIDKQFSVNCPCRVLFAEVSSKWSMMILTVIENQPHRFNEIKWQLEGISQKSLTQTLRRLERNGLLTRHVIQASPVAVEYALTELGRSLLKPFKELYSWTYQNMGQVDEAREEFDSRVNPPARFKI